MECRSETATLSSKRNNFENAILNNCLRFHLHLKLFSSKLNLFLNRNEKNDS